MEEFQQLLSKLQHSRQQKFLDFENILVAGTREDQLEKALQKKLNLLETTIEDQLNTHKKADTSKKQQLKGFQVESQIKEAKKTANSKLISTLQEELSHMLKENTFFKEATNVEPVKKYLEEEEAFSVKQLSLEIKKVTGQSCHLILDHTEIIDSWYLADGDTVCKCKGGWLQFVFTNINRQKPDSCFVFSLRIDENRTYVAGDCQPEISDMDVLIEKLNSSNNLSTFVRSIRKRFTDMANK